MIIYNATLHDQLYICIMTFCGSLHLVTVFCLSLSATFISYIAKSDVSLRMKEFNAARKEADRLVRFEEHLNFSLQCRNDGTFPNSLRLKLEPPFEDINLKSKWTQILDSASLTLQMVPDPPLQR